VKDWLESLDDMGRSNVHLANAICKQSPIVAGKGSVRNCPKTQAVGYKTISYQSVGYKSDDSRSLNDKSVNDKSTTLR
jgi:hypothetical protein